MNKQGDVSINYIILVIIALIVLVVAVLFFSGGAAKLFSFIKTYQQVPSQVEATWRNTCEIYCSAGDKTAYDSSKFTYGDRPETNCEAIMKGDYDKICLKLTVPIGGGPSGT